MRTLRIYSFNNFPIIANIDNAAMNMGVQTSPRVFQLNGKNTEKYVYYIFLKLVFLSFLPSFLPPFLPFLIFWLHCVLLLRVGFLQLRRAGFSCCGAQALSTRASAVVARGLQSAGSEVVAHGLSCSAACGVFPDHSSNPCPLHWQADSQPLCHQASPHPYFNKQTHPCLTYSKCLSLAENQKFPSFFFFLPSNKYCFSDQKVTAFVLRHNCHCGTNPCCLSP